MKDTSRMVRSFHCQGLILFALILNLSACNPNKGMLKEAQSIPYSANPEALSNVWANEGGEKIAQEDTRSAKASTQNSIWNHQKINLFAAKNEVIGFNLILEAANAPSFTVRVEFNHLDGPGGSKILSTPTAPEGVFDYTARDIELFYVRYLKIKGLSRLGFEHYDERHIPEHLRRPFSAEGLGSGTWNNRPDHDKSYPDIAVPMEAVNTFTIAAGQSQSVLADIYIPKDGVPGIYQGAVKVFERDHLSYTIPVELKVRGFALPDAPHSKTMLNLGYADIAKRYVGTENPTDPSDIAKVKLIRDRHFQMAHRHKISLIDNNSGTDGSDQPAHEWIPRLNGSLFSSANGYRGPGVDTGNGIFSVGTYGSWSWKNSGKAVIQEHADAWANWFTGYAPGTDYFLYLIDESSNYPQIESWAIDLKPDQKSGVSLASMATLPLPSAENNTPALEVVTSTMDVGDTDTWNTALLNLRVDPKKRFYMYNGKRPASGSFMIDDDGTALREVPWGQYKKGVDRWFYWESTYYKDFQSGRGQTDLFNSAQTFGGNPTQDLVLGKTSDNYANGDGVLFYPGTDLVYPESSYDLSGPIASVRLKEWRRGIQDIDYVALASEIDPVRTQTIVDSVVKSVLWENGIADPSDPTWVRCDIGWSNQADTWEAARAKLADIIEGQ